MKTASSSLSLVQWIIADKERYLSLLAHKEEMQTYNKRYSAWQRRDFIPEPQKRSLSFIQQVMGINRYRYWNFKENKFI